MLLDPAMWRFELSIILGAIASVLVIHAMREWMKLADEVRDRNSKMGLWMSRIFTLFMEMPKKRFRYWTILE